MKIRQLIRALFCLALLLGFVMPTTTVNASEGHGPSEEQVAAMHAKYDNMSKKEKIEISEKISAVGIIVVMGILGLIAAATAVLNGWQRSIQEREQRKLEEAAAAKAAAAVSAAAPQAKSVSDDGVSPKILAAISAAVAVVVGSKARVTSVRIANHSPSWTAAGRRSLMVSRRLPRR